MATDKKKERQRIKAYTKYSGLAYQMFGMLGVTIYLGLKADAYIQNESQYITALSALVVLFAFFYKISMDFTKN